MTYPWQSAVRNSLLERYAQGHFAHATLLSGPAGLGKAVLALDLAKSLLCLTDSGAACGACRSCELMKSGAHPDFREVTFELNDKGVLRTVITVKQVRKLISGLQLTNGLSSCKVAVIHPADQLHTSAANALLKTLEEPPGDAYLLLVSDNPRRLPATIRSRCQAVPVLLPDSTDAVRWLLAEEDISEELARLSLCAAAGSPLRALELVREGRAEQFAELDSLLSRLGNDANQVEAVQQVAMTLEPALAWLWLSLIAASQVKSGLRSGPGDSRSRQFSELQRLADQNRRLTATTVRKDLLLRDWLIQWARLSQP